MKLPVATRFLPELLANFLFFPIPALEKWGKQYPSGFRVPQPEGQGEDWHFWSPLALEQIFKSSEELLDSSQSGPPLSLFLGEEALLFKNGQPHLRDRRWLMPHFQSSELALFAQDVKKLAEKEFSAIGSTVNVWERMQSLSLFSVSRFLFGNVTDSFINALSESLWRFLGTGNDPLTAAFMTGAFFLPVLQNPLIPTWADFVEQREKTMSLIDQAIANSPQAGGITAKLLESSPDPAVLKDNLLTLFFAGYETTAAGLTWAFYWSHALPEVKRRILEELNHDAEAAMSSQSSYLSAVCREALRYFPVNLTATPRTVRSAIEIDGYEVPVGARIVPNIYLAHRCEKTYAQPDQFQPERFLSRKFSPYEFLPFGGGSRSCIGAAMVLTEMQQVLSTWFQRYPNAELTDANQRKPYRYGVIFLPPRDIVLKLRTRKEITFTSSRSNGSTIDS